jgi:hypothetical protein
MPSKRQSGKQHYNERGPYSSGSAFVEFRQRKCPSFLFMKNDRRDEKSTNHKDDGDTDVFAVEHADPSVKKNNGNYGQSSQAINFSSVVHSGCCAV